MSKNKNSDGVKFRVNKLKCAGCGACLQACPHGAIKIGKDGKAFIDQSKCKKCGTCQRICPFDAIEKISNGEKDEQPKTPSSSLSPSAPTPFPYGPPLSGGRGLGRGRVPGLSRRMGRKRGFKRSRD